MFERFTNHARKALALANEEAHRFHHEYLGTEHLLLGLVAEGDGMAAHVLKSVGADLARIRPEIDKLLRKGPLMISWGKLPMTPGAKRAIAYAIEEARGLNDSEVSTEHLLLGLMREVGGVAATVLRTIGITTDGLREAVVGLRRPD